ncbi:hypothetical protein HT136_01450 [Novosphingobium profundi]|uniref:hypothetical protein n=1 Tax=Novosphingobium profundi TaxID=1774954 RepID=UPI001BDAED9D|nr:hypothetical protein [Novosphingobium profundi]MBT0667032.1 hypothetical protein [Novosphingobium profundi]
MSISVCVAGLIAEGKIPQGQAAEADRLYGRHLSGLQRDMPMMAAASLASERTIASLKAQLNRKKYIAGLAVQTRTRILADMASFDGGGQAGAPIDPRAGPAFLAASDRARYSNVDGRMRAIRGRSHGLMNEILARHSANLLGRVRKPAELAELVRELFKPGSSSSLAAREMADAWRQTAEMLRQRFNAAGGDIGKLEDWGLPQYHDPRLVREAGFDAWRAAIADRLDRGRILDVETGRPLNDDEFEAMLRETFDRIRSDGWSKRDPGVQGQSILANRRAESRFLVFKGADDWMEYQSRFGAATAFDAMMGHIDGMARDIAMLEILGPNPSATLGWLKDVITKSAAEDGAASSKAPDAAYRATRQMDRLINEITGASQRPENRELALVFSTIRSLQTAAKLGGAMLSAVTDLAFGATTRAFNGLPVVRMLGDYVKLFRPGSIEDQKLAVRLGLIADEWSQRTAAQGRYLGEELTGEVSRRLAEGVLRVSGLSRWTQAGRWAHGMQLMGALTDARGKRFSELDKGFSAMLERYGIGSDAWDAIRKTPVESDRGVDWIFPQNVEDRALGDRLLEMAAREADFAVPTPDVATRATISSVAPRGTWHGEIIKSAFLFKSFGISLMLQHGARTMQLAGAQRLKYAGGLLIGTTAMGALAMWLKDVAAGRDPRAAFEDGRPDASFWSQAIIQGGGFGIFGDFVKSTESRAGGGLAGTVAGPVLGDFASLANIYWSKNHASAALKFARSQIPGGTLWYLRTAFDRAVADQIQEEIDPHYRQAWRRMDKWADEQGTDYWWAPGDAQPDRAPEFSNIAGDGR